MESKEELGTEIVAQTKTQVIKAGTSLFFDIAKFDHAQRVAKVFSTSTMVPEQFKGNIGNCIIALNLADRMKVDPFMLMQNMYIVHGKPGIEAKLAIALVNNAGKFTPLQYRYNSNKTSCYAYAKRTDTGELCEGVEVSLQMAKDEGWYGKTGSKWKTMPALMLMYRSAMFFARAFCPESLLGMQTKEELYDIVDMEVPAQKGGAYKLKNATSAAPKVAPEAQTADKEKDQPQKEETVTPPAFAALVKAEANKDYQYVATEKDGVANDNLSAYIEMVASNSDNSSSCEDVMEQVVAHGSFAGFWSGFLQGNWKKHFEGKLPVKPEATMPEEKPEPAVAAAGRSSSTGDSATTNAFDAVDWKSNHLRAKGLKTYYNTNFGDWNNASDLSKKEFRAKWARVFGETEPFPDLDIDDDTTNEKEDATNENEKPVSAPDLPDVENTPSNSSEPVINYAEKLHEYYEKEPERLLEACKKMNYNDMVIPMGKSSQKALYEMFQEISE